MYLRVKANVCVSVTWEVNIGEHGSQSELISLDFKSKRHTQRVIILVLRFMRRKCRDDINVLNIVVARQYQA